MTRKLLLLLFLFSFVTFSFSQIDRCSTDKMVQQQLMLNPDKKRILDQLNLFTKDFIKNNNDRSLLIDTTYIIPVVVHVIHNYGDERIDITQVQSAIQSMCDDFNKLNDDLVDSGGEFIPSAANSTDTVIISLYDITTSLTLEWLVENNMSANLAFTIQVSDATAGLDLVTQEVWQNEFSGGITPQSFNVSYYHTEGNAMEYKVWYHNNVIGAVTGVSVKLVELIIVRSKESY